MKEKIDYVLLCIISIEVKSRIILYLDLKVVMVKRKRNTVNTFFGKLSYQNDDTKVTYLLLIITLYDICIEKPKQIYSCILLISFWLFVSY